MQDKTRRDFFKEAESLAQLLSARRLSQEQAARLLGRTQSSISNKLRLLRIPPPMREKILSLGLSERHARALLRLPDLKTRERAMEQIAARALNVSQTEAYIESLLVVPAPNAALCPFCDGILRAVDTLRENGCRVELAESGRPAQLTIHIHCYKK